jgi:hypothetical protein
MKTIIDSENTNGKNHFTIPAIYAKKTGTISQFVLDNEGNS